MAWPPCVTGHPSHPVECQLIRVRERRRSQRAGGALGGRHRIVRRHGTTGERAVFADLVEMAAVQVDAVRKRGVVAQRED